jgi:hypothetical protein
LQNVGEYFIGKGFTPACTFSLTSKISHAGDWVTLLASLSGSSKLAWLAKAGAALEKGMSCRTRVRVGMWQFIEQYLRVTRRLPPYAGLCLEWQYFPRYDCWKGKLVVVTEEFQQPYGSTRDRMIHIEGLL